MEGRYWVVVRGMLYPIFGVELGLWLVCRRLREIECCGLSTLTDRKLSGLMLSRKESGMEREYVRGLYIFISGSIGDRWKIPKSQMHRIV